LDVTLENAQAGIRKPGGAMNSVPVTATLRDFSAGRGWLTLHDGQMRLALQMAEPGADGAKRITLRPKEDSRPYLNAVVELRVSMDVVLSTRGTVLPRPGDYGVVVPGIGRCTEKEGSNGAARAVVCYSPEPHVDLALELPGGSRQWIIGSMAGRMGQLNFGFRPLESYRIDAPELSGARLVTGHIVDHRSATLELESIRLSDYMPRR
jgi:hypothetical protein